MPWTHVKIAFYIAIALLVVYHPPKVAAAFRGIGGFIERHFGDSIGIYLLHLGIALIVLGDCFSVLTHVEQVGNSLLLTAMGVLKLKTVPGANGSSATTEVTTSVSGPDLPPPAAPQTSAPAHTLPEGWGVPNP